MSNLLMIGIIGGAVLLVVFIIFGLLISSSRKIDLDAVPEGESPEWIQSDIPEETREATLADREGITLYDHDPGEDLAAPFAEQIEDIVRAAVQADPDLRMYDVDFGTAPDGGIEFHIRGETYTAVDEIPHDEIRSAIKKAIARYNQQS